MCRLLLVSLVATLLWTGCSTPPTPQTGAHQHQLRADKTPPPLYTDLGSYQQKITTASPQAQAYFDQGLRLVYASITTRRSAPSARRRASIRPARCASGASRSPRLELQQPHRRRARGGGARGRPQARRSPAARATRERALHRGAREPLRAGRRAPTATPSTAPTPTRCARSRSATRRPRRGDALRRGADGPPPVGPVDARRQAAARAPRRSSRRSSACSRANPDHPGANHHYIHAVEASPDARARAEPRADRLGALMPGRRAHRAHAVAHLLCASGATTTPAAVNERAVAADRAYFASRSRAEPSTR